MRVWLPLLFGTLLISSQARAESAFLLGAQVGASYTDGRQAAPAVALRLGLGLDWLHESGATLLLRLETTHALDTTTALGLGYSGEGLRSGHGLPLGLALAATSSVDRHGDIGLGGRMLLSLSLWYGRAALELDLGLRTKLAPIAAAHDAGIELSTGLCLRFVPFTSEPW